MKRVAAVALLVMLATACGSSSKPAAPVEQPPVDLRGMSSVEIEANANLFTPATIEITEGTKVTWRNTDTVAHDVQKSSDAEDFGAPFGVRVPEFGPGQSYSFTFDKPGVYFYTCTIHTGMNGKIQVDAKRASTPTGSVTSSTAVG
jgi:plastocyanin